MRLKNLLLWCAVSCGGGLALWQPAFAADIDIYSDNAGTNSVPNVLFVIDTGANFSSSAAVPCTSYSAAAGGGAPSLGNTGGGVEQCALVDSIAALPNDTLNIGILVNNANNFATDVRAPADAAYHEICMGSAGGCVIRNLTLMTAGNKANLINFIKSWKISGSNSATEFNVKSGGDATAANMQEAWAYYNGKIGMSGKNYGTSVLSSGCQKNFVIFIGNSLNNAGKPGDSSTPTPDNSTTGLRSAQVAATSAQLQKIGDTVKFAAKTCGVHSIAAGSSASDWSQNWADEWARLMYQQDGSDSLGNTQNITTYSIGVIDNSGANTCKPDYPALLTTAAKYGGGKYFQTGNASEVRAALDNILNEVQAVNSVFSSASLPVSVNAQGTYLNQVFLGMFRPDATAAPRWLGNLKQYQFVLEPSTGALQLGDKNGMPALSSGGTGFISPNAVSFWSTAYTGSAPDTPVAYFNNDKRGAGQEFDAPDGELVEKGGAAQQLRSSLLTVNYSTSPASPRRFYTYCPAGTGCNADLTNSSNVFATSNAAITTAQLGVADSTARTALINWVRGEDNKGDEKGPGGAVTVRPSIHGDVLHSRPVVLNYGGTTGVVVFYGANDGVFRAVNGNQTAAIGGVPAGGELWGLVLPEHYSQFKRQRDNTPELKFPSTLSVTAQPKDYFVDGSAGVYQKLKADGTIDKAYLYVTMRRGGRFMYALDVSNPASPTVLWRVSSGDAGFSELGQTWSRPRVTLVNGYANPVLVFGAGYDAAAEDAEPPTASTMGRGLFVLDALTGVRVWSAGYSAAATACSGSATQASCGVYGMNWSIPADITFVDRNSDGKTDRLYAADVGGNVWRVDLEPTAGNTPDKWQVTKLAALGCNAGTCAGGATPRKFFYPPSVLFVGATGGVNAYDAVMLGSGDREHPLVGNAAYGVTNRFYMLKDTRTGLDVNAPTAWSTLTESDLDDVTGTQVCTNKGYYVTLDAGEKVVNASITVGGTTFFGTNRPVAPTPMSCMSNLGIAKGYALNPFSCTRNSTVYDGGGLPPTPVAGIVTVRQADGTDVQQVFCVGCGGMEGAGGGDARSALGAANPGKNVPKKPRRVYWYRR